MKPFTVTTRNIHSSARAIAAAWSCARVRAPPPPPSGVLRVLLSTPHVFIVAKPPALTSVPSVSNPTRASAASLLLDWLRSPARDAHADAAALFSVDDDGGAARAPRGAAAAAVAAAAAAAAAAFPRDAFAHVVHRLDEGTSGLMLFPRARPALAALARAFAGARVGKVYEAVLDARAAGAGSPLARGDAGAVALPLGRRAGVPLLHTAAAAAGGAPTALRAARTGWRVLERGDGAARVAFAPETGRTHQIRLHAAAALGAPVLGDALYGSPCALRDPARHFAREVLAPRLRAAAAPRGGDEAEALAAAREHAAAIAEAEALAAARAGARAPALASCAALARGAPPRLLLHCRELAVEMELSAAGAAASRRAGGWQEGSARELLWEAALGGGGDDGVCGGARVEDMRGALRAGGGGGGGGGGGETFRVWREHEGAGGADRTRVRFELSTPF